MEQCVFFEVLAPSDQEDHELDINNTEHEAREASDAFEAEKSDARAKFLKAADGSSDESEEEEKKRSKTPREKDEEEIERQHKAFAEFAGEEWEVLEEGIKKLDKIASRSTDAAILSAVFQAVEALKARVAETKKQPKNKKGYQAMDKRFKKLHKMVSSALEEKERVRKQSEAIASQKRKAVQTEESVVQQAKDILVQRQKGEKDVEAAIEELGGLLCSEGEEKVYVELCGVLCRIERLPSLETATEKKDEILKIVFLLERAVDYVEKESKELVCALLLSSYQKLSVYLRSVYETDEIHYLLLEELGKEEHRVYRMHWRVFRFLQRSSSVEKQHAAAIRQLEYVCEKKKAEIEEMHSRAGISADGFDGKAHVMGLCGSLHKSEMARRGGLLGSVFLFRNGFYEEGKKIFSETGETKADEGGEYRRAVSEAGVCAFRLGLFAEACDLLQTVCDDDVDKNVEYLFILSCILLDRKNKLADFITDQGTPFFFQDRSKSQLHFLSTRIKEGDAGGAVEMLCGLDFLGDMELDTLHTEKMVREKALRAFLRQRSCHTVLSVAWLRERHGVEDICGIAEEERLRIEDSMWVVWENEKEFAHELSLLLKGANLPAGENGEKAAQ
ncbi:MAG: uncharacterized protein A8A55_0106 [Amphiamblys sp. WSBS2006]|nr:MAG: uncharacterized protein A8A55_0106 [Amphiamblys sp. WSBS2006]